MTTSRISRGNQPLLQETKDITPLSRLRKPHSKTTIQTYRWAGVVRYSSSTDSPTLIFNLPIFTWKEIFITEYVIVYELGQILESNSIREDHMLVSRLMLITRPNIQYSVHQEPTYTWLSAALTLRPSPDITATIQHPHTHKACPSFENRMRHTPAWSCQPSVQ